MAREPHLANADGVKLLAATATPAAVAFQGEEATLSAGRGHLIATPGELLKEKGAESLLYKSNSHVCEGPGLGIEVDEQKVRELMELSGGEKLLQ